MPDSPAGPPTPPIPLAELLAREELGLRLIAGPAHADLLWVHTSEMADPYPYLLGGELLLTAGVQLADADTYVARLVQAGASALGFGVAPVHDTVPAALVEACEHHGLPLVEVPPETRFTAIARAVWRLMAEARHRELRRVTRAQQALATAAARPDPVPAVLRQLAVQLEGRVALLTADGGVLHAAGGHPAPDVRAALARLARVVAPAALPGTPSSPSRKPSPSSATDTRGDTHLFAYALGGGQGLVLALATPRRDSGDHTVAGIAVVLLSLLTAPHQGADAAGRSAALVRLLLGAAPQDVAPLLGDGDGDDWRVVHARRTDGSAADALNAGALGTALGSALSEVDRDTVRVLLPGRHGAVAAQPGWTLGVSGPAPVTALPDADIQASRALGHAEATRTPLATHRPGAGGLAALVPADRAEAHARALLAPLTDPLAETLRCWLSLHGSWDRTSVALKVHRNTVRQRIARCAALLDTDLDDMDVRTELWFALRQS
ncbi:PucR family transcriptional regulator [Streptomyces sp. JH34]|uniref:PucR family transcriptional regulator n=1 Tax=Streptomyces sp. JH34 TaxID=2793633 RepID=UPI0023F8997C|nr:PucR family transcriptional regulator [Streptomyces sp. JH34]MDF6021024.1 PucR family transcriptional regulator [Streptomyces sp. JH34]